MPKFGKCARKFDVPYREIGKFFSEISKLKWSEKANIERTSIGELPIKGSILLSEDNNTILCRVDQNRERGVVEVRCADVHNLDIPSIKAEVIEGIEKEREYWREFNRELQSPRFRAEIYEMIDSTAQRSASRLEKDVKKPSDILDVQILDERYHLMDALSDTPTFDNMFKEECACDPKELSVNAKRIIEKLQEIQER